jgi:dihydroflavonol-4-reductase
MKALVTGGTGFVGSHLVRLLNQEGHSARVLHRKTSKLNALEGTTYESAYGDVTELEALRLACEGVDVVFHVAAVADYWRADANYMLEVNVEGTRKVLQAARQNGVRRVIFTSSAAAIGFLDDRPSDEDVPFNMSAKQFPYGYSKVLAESVVKEAMQHGQDIVILNPVVIMGPGDLNMISGSFIVQMKRFGMFTPSTSGGVSVIDVRDVARYHLEAVTKGVTGERYVLATENYKYDTYFKMIAEVVGVRPPLINIPDAFLPPIAQGIDLVRKLGISTPIDANQVRLGAKNVFFNGQKAWDTFGKPQIDMMTSLKETYAWYVENGYIR